MTNRDLHIVRVPRPVEPEEQQRVRIINQNFERLRDTISRLQLTNGLIDETIIDHGELAGLGDDDHSTYPREDGTRGFSGKVEGIDPTDDAHLATKKYVDDTVVTDHGALSGLGDDDHTQYVLATGLREWDEQGGDTSQPATGKWTLYFKAGGLYYQEDDGTVVGPLTGGGGSSPLTTKGDIYTYAAADARLPVGTNGQVLSADSGETTGLKWITNSPSLPLTTKGDLLGYDSAAARVPVGSDDQVLTADSGETLGVKWATPAGGGSAPWWASETNYNLISKVHNKGGTYKYDGQQTPQLIPSSSDGDPAGTLMRHANRAYDTSPSANQSVGWYINYEESLIYANQLEGYTDMYMGAVVGIRGKDDLTHWIGLTGIAPNQHSTQGQPYSVGTGNGQWIGFTARGGTDANWYFCGTEYNSGYNTTAKDTSVAYSEDTIYFFEIVYDATGQTWKGYINGSLVATIDDTTEYSPTSNPPASARLKAFICVGNQNTSSPTDTQEIEWAQTLWCTRQTGFSGFAG